MNKYFVLLLLAIGLLFSCNKDESSFEEGTLGKYIADLGLVTQRDSLIACAASGQGGILQNTTGNISVLFYPPSGADNFRYYEFETPSTAGSLDLRNFRFKELKDEALFNGYLRRFVADISDKLCLVTFVKNGKLFISDPITIKGSSQPTDFNPPGTNIFNASSLSPSFTWSPSNNGVDKIYFQVVADSNGNLISGTYTEGTSWTFYDLSNVVLNIRDISPAPTLMANQDYKFVLMSVSDDNWVNTLIDQDFMTD